MEVLGEFVNVYSVFNMLNMQSIANRFNSIPLVGMFDSPIANNLPLTDIIDFTPDMLEAANVDSSSLIDLIDVDDILDSLAPVDDHYQEPVENTEEVSGRIVRCSSLKMKLSLEPSSYKASQACQTCFSIQKRSVA